MSDTNILPNGLEFLNRRTNDVREILSQQITARKTLYLGVHTDGSIWSRYDDAVSGKWEKRASNLVELLGGELITFGFDSRRMRKRRNQTRRRS